MLGIFEKWYKRLAERAEDEGRIIRVNGTIFVINDYTLERRQKTYFSTIKTRSLHPFGDQSPNVVKTRTH